MDRKIIEHKAARGHVLMLPHASLDEQAETLGRYFAMDWTGKAFTRCLLDNALLTPVGEQALQLVPRDVQESGEAVMTCPSCQRIYWRGSHYRRMMGRLLRWQEGEQTTC
jgi:hypothetical protein